jgi:site-specific DNA recombinase
MRIDIGVPLPALLVVGGAVGRESGDPLRLLRLVLVHLVELPHRNAGRLFLPSRVPLGELGSGLLDSGGVLLLAEHGAEPGRRRRFRELGLGGCGDGGRCREGRLGAHDVSGEKQRTHPHYLKGTIYCGQCHRRLSFTLAKGRYPYFFCLGRHQRTTTCQQPYLDVEAVEAAVERFWRTVRIPAEMKQVIQDGLRTELDTQHERAEPEIRRARARVEQLAEERRRLARGVVTGAIPDDLARDEHERILRDLEQAKRILDTSEMVYEHIQETLERCLDLLERVDEVYRLGSPRIRRLANQCFFTRLLVDGEQDGARVTGATLREPWATLLAEDFQARMRHNATNPDHDLLGRGSIMTTLVPPRGFEPPTHGLGNRCSIP